MAGMFPQHNPDLDGIVDYVPGRARGGFQAVDLDDDDDWDDIPEMKPGTNPVAAPVQILDNDGNPILGLDGKPIKDFAF